MKSLYVKQFVDEGIGNSSYLIASEETGIAAVIDPQRDVDRMLRLRQRAQVETLPQTVAPPFQQPQRSRTRRSQTRSRSCGVSAGSIASWRWRCGARFRLP